MLNFVLIALSGCSFLYRVSHKNVQNRTSHLDMRQQDKKLSWTIYVTEIFLGHPISFFSLCFLLVNALLYLKSENTGFFKPPLPTPQLFYFIRPWPANLEYRDIGGKTADRRADRQTDRQTDRRTDRQTETEIYRQTDRQKDFS